MTPKYKSLVGSWVVKALPPPVARVWVVLCRQLGETESTHKKRGGRKTGVVFLSFLWHKWQESCYDPNGTPFRRAKPSAWKEGCTLRHLVHWKNQSLHTQPAATETNKGQEWKSTGIRGGNLVCCHKLTLTMKNTLICHSETTYHRILGGRCAE